VSGAATGDETHTVSTRSRAHYTRPNTKYLVLVCSAEAVKHLINSIPRLI
jgi:hypothetical protein